jgi:hypothetical protein
MLMRAPALAAAAVCIGLIGGAASAETWTDPAGRFTFDAPRGWVVTSERTDGFSYVIAGTANNECQFIARPNANTANSPAHAARYTARQDVQFGETQWVRLANSLNPIFPNNSAQFISRSLDDSGPWPVQRAELQSPERPVHGGLQIRPGMDLMAFCLTYDGADPTSLYDGVIRSMGHPNDATWLADIQAYDAERASAAATAAATPTPTPETSEDQAQGEERRERRRQGDRRVSGDN